MVCRQWHLHFSKWLLPLSNKLNSKYSGRNVFICKDQTGEISHVVVSKEHIRDGTMLLLYH